MAVAEQLDQEGWVPADTFGARLAVIRQRMGWNVKAAAEACDLNAENWRQWERGRSPQKIHEAVRQISERTGCSYVWLLAGGPMRKTCFAVVEGTVHPGQQALHLPVLQSA